MLYSVTTRLRTSARTVTAKAGSANGTPTSHGPAVQGAMTLASVALACLAVPAIWRWLVRDMSTSHWKPPVPQSISHHALPDGFAERLEDIADEVALLVPTDTRSFTDRKREIQRKLWALAEFPYPVS